MCTFHSPVYICYTYVLKTISQLCENSAFLKMSVDLHNIKSNAKNPLAEIFRQHVMMVCLCLTTTLLICCYNTWGYRRGFSILEWRLWLLHKYLGVLSVFAYN